MTKGYPYYVVKFAGKLVRGTQLVYVNAGLILS